MTDTLGFTLALWQCDCAGMDAAARLLALDAALAGTTADLLLVPELFSTGYNAPDTIRQEAEPQGGPFAQAVAALACKHARAVTYGYPERGERGAIYNAAVTLDESGRQIGHHRKLTLPPGFEPDVFTKGQGITPFAWRGLRLAMVICYDVEFPETIRHAAQAGCDLVLVPTALGADWGRVAQRTVPTRAIENGIWVAYANHCGQEGAARYAGLSCIADPHGHDAARAGEAPQIIEARITRAAVHEARATVPYFADRPSF